MYKITNEEVVNECAKLLGVPAPKIELLDEEFFRTKTTTAALSEDGKKIYLKDGVELRWGFFSIAHEMRHLWKMQHDPVVFGGYKATDEAENVEAYNEQAAEIDANAWACLFMSSAFGIRPTLEASLGEELWSKIIARGMAIINEERGEK